jgi:uric acid-xanthine permease
MRILYREGLVGNYDYAFLFKPRLPFMAKPKKAAPFFGLNDKMPVLLAMLLGFQHALSMLAGGILNIHYQNKIRFSNFE